MLEFVRLIKITVRVMHCTDMGTPILSTGQNGGPVEPWIPGAKFSL